MLYRGRFDMAPDVFLHIVSCAYSSIFTTYNVADLQKNVKFAK